MPSTTTGPLGSALSLCLALAAGSVALVLVWQDRQWYSAVGWALVAGFWMRETRLPSIAAWGERSRPAHRGLLLAVAPGGPLFNALCSGFMVAVLGWQDQQRLGALGWAIVGGFCLYDLLGPGRDAPETGTTSDSDRAVLDSSSGVAR